MLKTRIASAQSRLVLALAMALIVSLGAHVVRTDGAAMAASEPVPAGEPDVLSARIGTVMGRSTLDLRETTIAPGEAAVVTVFVAMGRVILRVPAGWDVDTAALPAISRVSDTRDVRGAATDGAPRPRLVVRGVVMLGTVEVAS